MAQIQNENRNFAFVGDDEACAGQVYTISKKSGDDRNVHRNLAFVDDDGTTEFHRTSKTPVVDEAIPEPTESRPTWDKGLEFLMSCIAMSVGLGNVWRFPFICAKNGGGAFLIPYIIVLFLIGKPIYFAETIVGQFTSRSAVKIWTVVPGFRGIGWAQLFSSGAVGTYYCSLMSIITFYLLSSFKPDLPWSTCLPEWGPGCINSDGSTLNGSAFANTSHLASSAELYFEKIVLNQKQNINDGIGVPNGHLMLFLLLTWLVLLAILARGVHSVGKAAYFLALFPYVIMIALLIKAVTLEGAWNGIIYFIKPNWTKLFEAKVWYEAVVQCFFSLSVCFGGVMMYSSYNVFTHNIYRDVMVVTTLDSITSLLAGFTIFGILGNLAHELGTDDVGSVVRGGTGLAFVSYPEAISKLQIFPQLFSVLFFAMLYILGIGSGIAIAGGVTTIIKDQFPNAKHWRVVLGVSIVGYCIGIFYCTPGGQFILALVDYYAASFIVFLIAVLEMAGIFWIYGLEQFLEDTEFMLKQRPSIYWRLCWVFITPVLLCAILIYSLINLTPLTYNDEYYPEIAYVIGWSLFVIGSIQIPFWLIYTIYSNRDLGIKNMVLSAFRPSKDWGPSKQVNAVKWKEWKELKKREKRKRNDSKLKQFLCVLFAQEHKLS